MSDESGFIWSCSRFKFKGKCEIGAWGRILTYCLFQWGWALVLLSWCVCMGGAFQNKACFGSVLHASCWLHRASRSPAVILMTVQINQRMWVTTLEVSLDTCTHTHTKSSPCHCSFFFLEAVHTLWVSLFANLYCLTADDLHQKMQNCAKQKMTSFLLIKSKKGRDLIVIINLT